LFWSIFIFSILMTVNFFISLPVKQNCKSSYLPTYLQTMQQMGLFVMWQQQQQSYTAIVNECSLHIASFYLLNENWVGKDGKKLTRLSWAREKGLLQSQSEGTEEKETEKWMEFKVASQLLVCFTFFFSPSHHSDWTYHVHVCKRTARDVNKLFKFLVKKTQQVHLSQVHEIREVNEALTTYKEYLKKSCLDG